MKLSAPKNHVSLGRCLFVLALLAQFGIVSGLTVAMPWLWIAAFVLLALGVLFNDF